MTYSLPDNFVDFGHNFLSTWEQLDIDVTGKASTRQGVEGQLRPSLAALAQGSNQSLLRGDLAHCLSHGVYFKAV